MKHLFQGNRAEFEREVEILARLSTWRNPHFVKLLITIEISSPHGKDLYLVFPWADADLLQLWQGHKATAFADGAHLRSPHQCTRWVARQCYGLTQALSQLHYLRPKEQHQQSAQGAGESSTSSNGAVDDATRLYGVHGDIKPQNILWYQCWDAYDDPFGLLQLADFGTGDIHHYISKSDFRRQGVQVNYLVVTLERYVKICSQ